MRVADLHFAIGAFGLVAIVGATYLVRSFRNGRAHHARTDVDGGSILLGKALMDVGYWLLAPLVGGLAAWRVTPAMVTLFALIPALAAGIAAALGWFALAALLGAGAAFCDLLDGLLARRLGVVSRAGEALDAAVDRYTEGLFLAGIAIYYRTNVACLMLALTALFGSFMVSYTSAKAQAMNVPAPRGHMRRPERAVYLLVAAALTGVTKAVGDKSDSLVLREFPILLSLALVATVTNVSTVTRLRAVMGVLRARSPVLRPAVVEKVAAAPAKAPARLG